MKFEYDESDINYIKKINDSMDENGNTDFPLFISDKDITYSIEFKAIDVAKANTFVTTLMNGNPKYLEEVTNVLGIDVRSISTNRNKYSMKEDMKQRLTEMINEVDQW